MNSKKPVKFIPVFLIFALILIVFASCQTNTGGDGGTTKEPGSDSDSVKGTEEQTGELSDNLPDDLDFGGATVNIAYRLLDASYPCCNDFTAEGETGDIFNDAKFRRNMAVEERLNVTLNFIPEPYASMPGKLRASILAGDNAYDIIAGSMFSNGNVSGLALEGLFMNLKDVPHIDFEKPWWYQSIVSGATIGNKLHFIAGDANLSVLMSSMLLFVNKKLMQEYTLPDVYNVVIDGKWTIDYMISYIKDVHKDLNGDGVMDKNDLYGFISPNYASFFNAFMEGAGIQVTKIGSDGNPYFDMPVERMSALADKVCELLYNNPSSFITAGGDGVDENMFRNNQALFIPYAIQDAVYWKEMESDFGMVPYPKFDEAQEKYYSSVWEGCTLFSIPVNSVTPEMAGAVMEAFSFESYRTTTPVYFDIVMKLKEARDETTSKMLDIIRDGAYIDFSTIYNSQIGSPWDALYASTQRGSNNFASWYESNEPKIRIAIEKLIENME